MEYQVLTEQPPDDREWTFDGVFVKQLYVRKAGAIVPQHSHAYDHGSFVAAGAVRVWRDGVRGEVVKAPAMIVIKAGVKHRFDILQDETIVYCVHNLHSADRPEILEEHQLTPCGDCAGCSK